MHALVMAGAKPVACFSTQEEANAFKDFLDAAGVTAPTVVAGVVPGVDGNPSQTCDDYLKGADAIVSEVVSLLNG